MRRFAKLNHMESFSFPKLSRIINFQNMILPKRNKPTDAEFVEKQLAKTDAQALEVVPKSDEVIEAEMGLAPARPLEVMPKIESTNAMVLKPEEIRALTANFPDSDFQRGAGGDPKLIYLEHVALRRRLNDVVGLGQWRFEVVKSWTEDFTAGNPPKPAVRIYIEGRLIIRGVQFGSAIGDGVYYKSNAASNYGDGYESAKTYSFRRCCKDFGIGLQAFSRDFCEEWKSKYPNFDRPTKK